MKCNDCGKEFDPSDLDQVSFHCGGHKPVIVTQITGTRIEVEPFGIMKIDIQKLREKVDHFLVTIMKSLLILFSALILVGCDIPRPVQKTYTITLVGTTNVFTGGN